MVLELSRELEKRKVCDSDREESLKCDEEGSSTVLSRERVDQERLGD